MKDVRWLSPKMANTGKLWEVIFNAILLLFLVIIKTDNVTENTT